LAVPLVVSLGLGLYRLGLPEPHVDFRTVEGVFAPPWLDFLADFLTPDGLYGGVYPPVYFVLAKAYGGLVGSDLVSLRTLSVLALAALVVVSWCGFPLLATRTSPLLRFWFVLAVATSPAHIWWAQTAKYVMWLYLIYAIAILASLRFLFRPDRRSAVLLVLSFILLFGTHYVSFFFILSSFVAMASIGLLTRDRRLLRALVRAGAFAALLTVPVLPAVVSSLLLQRGGYQTQFNQEMTPGNLARALVVDWNFGHALLPKGGGFLGLHQAIASFRSSSTLDTDTLKYLSPAIIAAGVSAVGFAHAGLGAFHDSEARRKAFYVVAVIALTLLFSATKGLVNRFTYFGFGTWCTLAFLAIGWGAGRSRKGPLVLGGGILALNAFSLGNYYSNLELKYPGARIIADYLRDSADGVELVIVDRWIVETRDSPPERENLPPELAFEMVDSAVALRAAEDRGVTLAFLAGTIEELQRELENQEPQTPVTWTYLRSFDSMESRERSIHLYRFVEAAPR
jgi:hypothetical protein